MKMQAEAVTDLPLVTEDTDLAGDISEAVNDPDVVCVASTVVSKAEGRLRSLADYEPSKRARRLADGLGDRTAAAYPRFVEAVLQESVELLIEDPFLLAETEFGHVAPNAGVDRSNVEGDDRVLLLPDDPDASAARLASALESAVVVTDTCGRPFRLGQTGVALGWSGLSALRDWRGETDLHGQELEATEQAVVDELAAAANHLMGEGDDGAPVVELTDVDLDYTGDDRLYRPEDDDVVKEALRMRRDSRQGREGR